jgi:hypothetical protein
MGVITAVSAPGAWASPPPTAAQEAAATDVNVDVNLLGLASARHGRQHRHARRDTTTTMPASSAAAPVASATCLP